MNTLVFSKDRPFQLYSLLETFQKHVKDTPSPKLVVQFLATNEDYMNGYINLNSMFQDVEFVDEKPYGFLETFRAVVNEFGPEDEYMSFESDDTIYFKDIDVVRLKSVAEPYKKTCGRVGMSMDVNIYDPSNFKIIDKEKRYTVIDRTATMSNKIQEMCLKYPFGVQGALVKVSDLKELLTAGGFNNPIQTEIVGSQCPTFVKYEHVLFNTEQVCTFCHFNNDLKRYAETAGNDRLNKLFMDGYVVDWESVNIPSLKKDMRWFDGEDIGRFPIFPWDIDPKFHDNILKTHLKRI